MSKNTNDISNEEITLKMHPDGSVKIYGTASLKAVLEMTCATIEWFCIAFYAEGISQNSLCKELVSMVMKATQKHKPETEEAADETEES